MVQPFYVGGDILQVRATEGLTTESYTAFTDKEVEELDVVEKSGVVYFIMCSGAKRRLCKRAEERKRTVRMVQLSCPPFSCVVI